MKLLSGEGDKIPWIDKSTLVQVMAWCRQATSHYQSQCKPRYTRTQWVKTPLYDNGKLLFRQRRHNISVHHGWKCGRRVAFDWLSIAPDQKLLEVPRNITLAHRGPVHGLCAPNPIHRVWAMSLQSKNKFPFSTNLMFLGLATRVHTILMRLFHIYLFLFFQNKNSITHSC